MLRIFHTHPARTSLLQDFAFYEVQQYIVTLKVICLIFFTDASASKDTEQPDSRKCLFPFSYADGYAISRYSISRNFSDQFIWSTPICNDQSHSARIRGTAHGYAWTEHEHEPWNGHEPHAANADEYGHCIRQPSRHAECDAASQPRAHARWTKFHGYGRHARFLEEDSSVDSTTHDEKAKLSASFILDIEGTVLP